MAARLHALGIRTAPELRAVPLSDLMRHFGQSGYDFYRFVRGIDDRPVRSSRVRKSVGCERTFERDVRDPVRLRGIIGELAAELAFRLGRADFAGSTLSLKVRSHDFTTRTRSVAAEVPYDANAMTRLAEDACRLLAGMEIPKGGVRLLGLAVGSPAPRDDGQPSLFEGLEA